MGFNNGILGPMRSRSTPPFCSGVVCRIVESSPSELDELNVAISIGAFFHENTLWVDGIGAIALESWTADHQYVESTSWIDTSDCDTLQ